MDQVSDNPVAQRTWNGFRTSRLELHWELIEPWTYLLALGLTEVVADLWLPVVGLYLHALLAAWLIWRGARAM